MLCSGIYHRNGELDRSQQIGNLIKLECAEFFNQLSSPVKSIDTLITCSMTGLAVNGKIQHHQALLGHCGLHTGRLTYQCHIHLGKALHGQFHSVLSVTLLLDRSQEQGIVRLLLPVQLIERIEQ